MRQSCVEESAQVRLCFEKSDADLAISARLGNITGTNRSQSEQC